MGKVGARALAAVTEVSSQSDEDVGNSRFLPPVGLLSDDSTSDDSLELQGSARKKKRKRKFVSSKTHRDRLQSKDRLEQLVSQKCKRCTADCAMQFQYVGKFKELVEYRQHFGELHKLDQDQLVSWMRFLLECKHIVQCFCLCRTVTCLRQSGFRCHPGSDAGS